MSEAKKWIGYVRVSTVKQAEEGVSLAVQREKLQQWAALSEVDLVEIVEDAGSSGTLALAKRPGGQRILEALESGAAGGVVAVRLNRLFRSTKDAIGLLDSRHKVASLTENLDTSSAMGRFVVRLLANLAELESDQIAERTREAMLHLRAKGVQFGREGYGWYYTDERDDNGYRIIEADEHEQEVIGDILSWREDGASLPFIARRLNRRGETTKNDGEWHPASVRRVITAAGTALHQALVENGRYAAAG